MQVSVLHASMRTAQLPTCIEENLATKNKNKNKTKEVKK
jgi:hypothetical protein